MVLALGALVPLLATHPGKLAADTKSYLYINPAGVMRQALSMWDSFVGNGTVTHQYIGYLFPMGPYYWLVQHLGIPMWVGQRLWLAGIFFAAGSGVLFLFRHLGLGGPGRPVAAFAFMVSPYVLSYSARLSALLLPWAGIGWLVGFTLLALRRGGWRYPALFALVVAVTGTVNATSLIYAGFAPLLLVPYAVRVARECSWGDALRAVLRIAVLSLAVSLWWIVGLIIEFSYALNIVVYTESIPTVTLTSLSSEVLRGLGYWYFYGEDQIDHYVQAAPPYMASIWYLLVGFALPAVQMGIGMLSRWRYKAYCAFLVLAGVVLSVGAYPFRHSTPFGAALKTFQSTGIAGLALRSDNRAVPLILLGLAGLTAAGIEAVWIRHRVGAAMIGVVLAGGAAATLPSLWTGSLIGTNLLFPSHLPSYYHQEADYLNTHRTSTRVLDEPGDDFAYYTWGTTIDPVDPALLTRPFVAREQVPYGSAASADLLNALDETIQEDTFNPLSLAPIARLMSAGDIVLRSDLAYERFNTPRPVQTWSLFDPPPPGLSGPIPFGKPQPAKPSPYPLVDETALATSPSAPWPPPLAVFPVSHTRPIVRTEPATRPIVLDGNGAGMVAAAGAGLLDRNPTIFYSATFAHNGAALKKILHEGAELVVTDTNYLAQERWGSVRENVGYIQVPGEPVLVKDYTAHSLPLFPGEKTADQTVAQLHGIRQVVATSYGNPISFVPENRPTNAFDGNPSTVWTTGAFGNPVGARIRAILDHQVTTDHLVFVQPLQGPRDRFITRITITFGNGHGSKTNSVTATLGEASRTPAGQRVSFSRRTFSTLEVRIDRINLLHEKYFAGVSGVGFAEIGIPGVTMHRVIRMPTDLLRATGASSLSHPLVLSFNRRQAPPVPPRTDPELSMSRQFTLPTARSFSLSGTARISALIPDQTIDQLLGRPGSDGSGIVMSSSGRLPGDLNARASMALDGNPSTAWMPGIGPQAGGWIQANFPSTRSFSHLNLQVVADGRHSVPTRITLSSASGSDVLTLPGIVDSRDENATATVPLTFAPLTGDWLRLTIQAVRAVNNIDYYSGRPVTEPVGIAELGIPGSTVPPVPSLFPGVCRSNLLSIDGHPVSLQVTGTNQVAASETGTSLSVRGCGPDANGIELGAGTHLLTTGDGSRWQVGINLNTLEMSSAAGGHPMPLTSDFRLPSPTPGSSPAVHVVSRTDTSYRLRLEHPTAPFWLVLGQSLNSGWHATITAIGTRPAHIDLGAPTLIDGMSNGWQVRPPAGQGPLTVSIAWTPQRWVLPALVFSALALLLCIGLAIRQRTGDRARIRSSAPPRGISGLRRRAAIASLLMAAVSGVFVSPLLALPAALLVAAGCYLRPIRILLAAAGPVLLLATGVYYAAEEAAYHWHALFGWATHFQAGNSLGWLAVMALIAYVVVDATRTPVSRPEAGNESLVVRRSESHGDPGSSTGHHEHRR